MKKEKTKCISVSLITYVNLGHYTNVDVEVPEGLSDQEEKDFIKIWIENELGNEIDYIGEPEYDHWYRYVTSIEAQYNDDTEKDGEVIFITDKESD